MHVIIIHGRTPTAALVDNLENLPCSYEEIDSEDSAQKIRDNPVLQKQLQNIFKEVMLIHGIAIKVKDDTNSYQQLQTSEENNG